MKTSKHYSKSKQAKKRETKDTVYPSKKIKYANTYIQYLITREAMVHFPHQS
jgi:uncharacterized Rossmann fold enzyme